MFFHTMDSLFMVSQLTLKYFVNFEFVVVYDVSWQYVLTFFVDPLEFFIYKIIS